MQGRIYLDISEFLARPMRTGIQRVVFDLMRFWPDHIELCPGRVDASGQFVRIDSPLLPLMSRFFEDDSARGNLHEQAISEAANRATEVVTREHLNEAIGLLNPELFFDPIRIGFYRQLLQSGYRKLSFMVYDMLPWLHPEWFPSGAILATMDYLRLTTRVPYRSFISEQSASDFHTRILKHRVPMHDLVTPLGADGLGIREPKFDAQSRQFLVIGSLEPRKNPMSVLEAFATLWKAGTEVDLVFLGRLGCLPDEDRCLVQQMEKTQPRFKWIQNATDSRVREELSRSRATIYPSLGEGYGMPPVESLALGVPVIVSGDLPSVQMIDPRGQIRLPQPTPEAIRTAVESLLNDATATEFHEEVRQLQPHLPRVAEMAPKLCQWIEQTHALGGRHVPASCSRGEQGAGSRAAA